MESNIIDLEEFLIRSGQRLRTYIFNEVSQQSGIELTAMHFTYEHFCFNFKDMAKVWVGENLLGFVNVYFDDNFCLRVKYSAITFQVRAND